MTTKLISRTLWNFFRPAAAFAILIAVITTCSWVIQQLTGASGDTSMAATLMLGFVGLGFVWAYEQAKVDLESESRDSESGPAAPSAGDLTGDKS